LIPLDVPEKRMTHDRGIRSTSMANLDRRHIARKQVVPFLIAGALLVVAYPQGVRAAGTDQPACAGNCDGQDGVTTSDLVTMLGAALGTTDVSACPAGDVAVPSGVITVDEIVTGIGFALTSCPGASTPSSTATATQTVEATTPPGIATATPTQTVPAGSPLPTASPTGTVAPSPTFTVTPNTTTTPTPSASQTATPTPTGTAGGLTVCHTPSLAIPDYPGDGVFDQITIAQDVPITKVRIQVHITHSWVGDLEVDLVHSYDDVLQAAILLYPPGDCGGSNVDCVLDDAAEAYADDQCTDGTPAISGTLRPTEPLATFEGQSSSGTWQLYVYDLLEEDVGTFDSWCIEIE
jgi:hypothetical protein